MRLQSRLGSICSAAYLAVFLLAEFIVFGSLIFDTRRSELSGLFAIVVTLPWSVMLRPLWDAAGFIKWYGRFAGTPAVYGLFASMTVLPGAIINAAILYHIGRAVERVTRKRHSR